MVEPINEQFAALRAEMAAQHVEVAALKKELASLRGENETLRRRGQLAASECEGSTTPNDGVETARPVNRRGLLAAAGGLLVAGRATPAGAPAPRTMGRRGMG